MWPFIFQLGSFLQTNILVWLVIKNSGGAGNLKLVRPKEPRKKFGKLIIRESVWSHFAVVGLIGNKYTTQLYGHMLYAWDAQVAQLNLNRCNLPTPDPQISCIHNNDA